MGSRELHSIFPTKLNGPGCLLWTILGTTMSYKRGSTVKGPLMRLILTEPHDQGEGMRLRSSRGGGNIQN